MEECFNALEIIVDKNFDFSSVCFGYFRGFGFNCAHLQYADYHQMLDRAVRTCFGKNCFPHQTFPFHFYFDQHHRNFGVQKSLLHETKFNFETG